MSSYGAATWADSRPRHHSRSQAMPPPLSQAPPPLSTTHDHLFPSNLVDEDVRLSATEADASLLLSPYSYTHTLSTAASPSCLLSSTPADDLSDYGAYQTSEHYSDLVDDFFGTNLNTSVPRAGSLPTALHPHDAVSEYDDAKTASARATLAASGTSPSLLNLGGLPPSPAHSTTVSPSSEAQYTKGRSVIAQRDINADLSTLHIPTTNGFLPTHTPSLQLTPDHSGSSHTSGEGLEPSIMGPVGHSPAVMVSQWDLEQSPTQIEPGGPPEGLFPGRYTPASARVDRDDHGQWVPDQVTGQGGLDPSSRQHLSSQEVPSLKEQEERRRIDGRNSEVDDWRSQASGECNGANCADPNALDDMEPRMFLDDCSSLAPVDDAASIRDNRLLEGQTYYAIKQGMGAAPPTEDDIKLMGQPRQFNDAPALPYATTTRELPPTANDAIRQYNAHADTFSLSSRAATWGTRRKSEPSLKDYDAIADGSFLKKLHISKPLSRQNSLFDQGLDRLANIVRKRSNSGLKRARSVREESPSPPHPPQQQRHNSQGSLLTLPRSPSFGRRATPSINTALAAMSGPLAAVGTTHARSGSVGVLGTSPSPRSQSPLAGITNRIIQRARSKSELTPSQDRSHHAHGLVGLLRGNGGPPVANLVPGQDVERRSHSEAGEAEEDDEEEEDFDDADMRMATEDDADPIEPTYEGFKAHVRRLNPDMDPRYHWLVSRIAHQQEIRYKNLLELRVKHHQSMMRGDCASGPLCTASGGGATLLDVRGKPRAAPVLASHLHPGADASKDSNQSDGVLTEDTFPIGVPMPPTRNLPAEFECRLCFKSKKFQKPSDWTKHVHEDVQPFTCTYEKCKEPKSFKRKADWVRHENERHRHLEWWVCQMDDCRHPCYRKDNFLQHLVREHKLPEPKQKTKAAIKKARTTEIAWVMLERCHHDTQNKPQDEPCKFCGKTFTSWKKLTVHLAKHMEHISLPVLKLVEQRVVDADTVISPVESKMTPITPVAPQKFESVSPIGLHEHASVLPQYHGLQPHDFYSTTTVLPSAYQPQPAMPSSLYSDTMLYSNAYAGHTPIDKPRSFSPLDSNLSIDVVDPSRGAVFHPLVSSFPAPAAAYTPHLDYSPQPRTQVSHQAASPYADPHSASGYSTSSMMNMPDATFAYGVVPPAATPHSQTQFSHLPVNRALGSTSPYATTHPASEMSYYSQ